MGEVIGFVMIVVVIGGLWVVPWFLGASIMGRKGQSTGGGFALGFFLGWLGVIIAALVPYRPGFPPPEA